MNLQLRMIPNLAKFADIFVENTPFRNAIAGLINRAQNLCFVSWKLSIVQILINQKFIFSKLNYVKFWSYTQDPSKNIPAPIILKRKSKPKIAKPSTMAPNNTDQTKPATMNSNNAPAHSNAETKYKMRLFLVMCKSVQLAEISEKGIGLYKSMVRTGAKIYSDKDFLSLFDAYLKPDKKVNETYSCAFTTMEGAKKYIQELHLRGWEDGNPDKYKNVSNYNGPDFAPIVFEIEHEVRDCKLTCYCLRHTDIQKRNVIAAHLEGTTCPINPALKQEGGRPFLL